MLMFILRLDRYRAGAQYPIPDIIGRSYTDTDTNTRNDITHSVRHMYITYVAHTIHTFQNITSLCFEMYIRYTYAASSW